MNVDWALYDLLLGAGSEISSAREEIINNTVQNFVDGIEDDPAYQDSTTVNGVITPLIVSPSSSSKCEIKAPPGTGLVIGDIVEYLGETWLVTELYIDKIGVINGIMRMCNMAISFQNRGEDIYKEYCIVDDGTISKRSSSDHVYAQNGTYDIYVSINDVTRMLYVDKRISLGTFFDGNGDIKLEVYKIINVDLRSRNFGDGSHLMILTVQRDVYNPATDDINTGICDVYRGNHTYIDPGQYGLRCEITGRDRIRIGTTSTFNALFYNKAGEIVTVDNPTWHVMAGDGISFSCEDDSCMINIPFDEQYIGEIVEMQVSDDGGAYGTCVKKVEVIPIG